MINSTPVRRGVIRILRDPAFMACWGLMLQLLCSRVHADEPPAIERLTPQGAQQGTTVDVKFVGKAGDGTLRILSASESLGFAVAENRESATVTVAPDARPGVHWLRFCNEFGATELKPFLVGTVPEVTDTEPNARLVDAQQLPGSSITINGVLATAGDVDTFAVSLTKGQSLVASLQAHRWLGSPMDGVLQILNERGAVVAQNDDDTGLDPRLEYSVPSDGTWYVRAFAFPAAPNSTIAFAGGADFVYRLTLATGADASVPWGFAGTIEPPIQPADQSAEVPGGQALPVTVNGQILAAGERDQVVVSLLKDQKLSICVEAALLGSLLDPVVRVTDPDGKLIEEKDDISDTNRDAELHLTIPSDGAFTIEVRDRFRHFGDRWFYRLRCEETRPSFSARLSSTAFTLTGEKSLEIPVTIERRHGFAEPVQLHVEGLPEGIALECPRSEKEGDTAQKVVMKLTTTGNAAFSGTVRIAAEAVDSGLKQAVSFVTADGTQVEGLWLTVR